MKRILKKAFIVLTFISILVYMDVKFFSIKRAVGRLWEPYGGHDYLMTGLDIFTINEESVSGDTLIVSNDKKYLFKYCIFGRLWISDINKTYTAKYVKFKGSDAW